MVRLIRENLKNFYANLSKAVFFLTTLGPLYIPCSMEETYTIGQAAEKIGVSASTLRRWEKAGKIPPFHRTLGGHRRVKKEAIKNMLSLPKYRGISFTEK